MNDEPNQPRFLTMTQVADELNVKQNVVQGLIRTGELRAFQVGGRGLWRIGRRDFEEEYIERAYQRTAERLPEGGIADEGDAEAETAQGPIKDALPPRLRGMAGDAFLGDQWIRGAAWNRHPVRGTLRLGSALQLRDSQPQPNDWLTRASTPQTTTTNMKTAYSIPRTPKAGLRPMLHLPPPYRWLLKATRAVHLSA